MQYFFTIETEAEARRQELTRLAAADARAAQAIRATPIRRRFPRFTRSAAAPATGSVPAMPTGVLPEVGRVPRPVAC